MDPFWAEYPRDVARVSGPGARSYLHSQLSNDVEGLAVGASRWAFALEPTGKVIVLLRVHRTADEEYVLDTDAGFGEAMIARLNRFKIRVKAEIELLAWRCIAVRGLGSGDGVESWGGGYDLLGVDVTGPDALPEGDLEAARIAAAFPGMGAEITPGTTIPAETGVLDLAVNFTKGCYPGQELVERMHSRGASAPRQVRRIDVPLGTAVGEEVEVGGHKATITSVRGTAALALVRRA